MPSVGSSITTQTSPMAAGVATIGRISSARSRLRPEKRLIEQQRDAEAGGNVGGDAERGETAVCARASR